MKNVTFKNKDYSITEFAHEFGLGIATVSRKLKAGNDIEDIVRCNRMKTTTVEYNGNRYKLSELCTEFGVSISTLMNALKAGIGIHEFMDKLKHSEKPNEFNKFEQQIKTTNEKPDPEISVLNDKEILPVMVKDPVNLAEIIAGKCKKFNTVNLIDFENLSDNHSIINELLKENSINVFFFNGCIYANDFFKLMHDQHKEVYYVVTTETSSQLVDHLMVYYSGFLAPLELGCKIKFNLVSKDSGFYKLQKYINNKNISAKGMNFVEKKDDKFILSIAKYMINNRYINHNTAIKKDEFETIFGNFFKLRNKEITDQNINNLVNKLLDLDFLEYHPETNNYSEFYSINLVNAKQELRRLKKSRA